MKTVARDRSSSLSIPFKRSSAFCEVTLDGGAGRREVQAADLAEAVDDRQELHDGAADARGAVAPQRGPQILERTGCSARPPASPTRGARR